MRWQRLQQLQVATIVGAATCVLLVLVLTSNSDHLVQSFEHSGQYPSDVEKWEQRALRPEKVDLVSLKEEPSRSITALQKEDTRPGGQDIDPNWVPHHESWRFGDPISPLPDFEHPHDSPGQRIVFTGHVHPDVDSIASSVGAAHLFGGVAMHAGVINHETQFLLNHFRLESPLPLNGNYQGEPFIIVDHNAFSQRPKILNARRIRGIFDHHALSRKPTLVPDPIYIDSRPWGSCSTLIATKYLEHKRKLPYGIAGLLMGGILSDTLNLRSPTTTQWDKKVLHWLARMVEWPTGKHGKFESGSKLSKTSLKEQVGNFAHRQFQAKANLSDLSLKEIVLSDFKTYYLGASGESEAKLVVGWGTVETVEPFYSHYLKLSTLQRAILNVLPDIKNEKDLESVFVTIVDIEREVSVAICSNSQDCQLLTESFPDSQKKTIPRTHGLTLEVSPRVSRKEEFLPPLRKTLLNQMKGN